MTPAFCTSFAYLDTPPFDEGLIYRGMQRVHASFKCCNGRPLLPVPQKNYYVYLQSFLIYYQEGTLSVSHIDISTVIQP